MHSHAATIASLGQPHGEPVRSAIAAPRLAPPWHWKPGIYARRRRRAYALLAFLAAMLPLSANSWGADQVTVALHNAGGAVHTLIKPAAQLASSTKQTLRHSKLRHTTAATRTARETTAAARATATAFRHVTVQVPAPTLGRIVATSLWIPRHYDPLHTRYDVIYDIATTQVLRPATVTSVLNGASPVTTIIVQPNMAAVLRQGAPPIDRRTAARFVTNDLIGYVDRTLAARPSRIHRVLVTDPAQASGTAPTASSTEPTFTTHQRADFQTIRTIAVAREARH